MKRDFETILDESLSRLKQKESIEACLGRYPQYAAQLEPLLQTALKVEMLKDTEPPSAQAMAASREHFLREAARLWAERAPAHKLARGPAGKTWILPLVVVALLAGLLLLVLASLLMLAVLIRLNAPDVFHWPYRQWATPRPQPTMIQPATDTPWPTMTPTFTYTPEPTDTPVPTATPVPPTDTPVPTMTPMPPTDTPYPDEGDSDDDVNDDEDDDNDDDDDDDDDGEGEDDDDEDSDTDSDDDD